jgi:hypothetical protein
MSILNFVGCWKAVCGHLLMPCSNPSPGVEALQRYASHVDVGLGSLIIHPRLIHTGPETQGQSITSTTQSLCLMMNFLTLCCNASLRFCSEVSISALLSTVATCTSKFSCSRLICHLLTMHSSIGHSRSNKSRTQNEIPWEIALSFPRSDLLVACERTYPNPGSWSSRMM